MSDTQTTLPQVGDKKAKQKAADEKRRALRKDAFDKLLAQAKKILDANILDEADQFELKSAVFNLRPLRSAQPVARITVQAMLKELFGDRKAIGGDEVYAAFRAGKISTPDLRKVLTLAIKTGKPEDRLWISYDAKNDAYLLEGTGPTAPNGWMGYTPADVAVQE
jgi:hypothetical protein